VSCGGESRSGRDYAAETDGTSLRDDGG